MITNNRLILNGVFSRPQLSDMAALANTLNDEWQRMSRDPDADETARNAIADAWHGLNDVLRLSGEAA